MLLNLPKKIFPAMLIICLFCDNNTIFASKI